jgi:hypothetical protein
MVYLKSGWNFCGNLVNPALAGFENSKSGAPVKLTQNLLGKQW